MDFPSFEKVEAKLKKSLDCLWQNDKYLFEKDVNERSISHMLALYLKHEFEHWHVDCEYNKDHHKPKRLKYLNECLRKNTKANMTTDTEGRTVYPDIIVHHRGTDDNLLVIEMKKTTSNVSDNCDLKKLKQFHEQLGYYFSVFIRVNTGKEEADRVKTKWICKNKKLCS